MIDTELMEFRLPQEKVAKFREMVEKYVKAVFITRKRLEQLNGLISHCAQIIQAGCIFARRCYNMYLVLVLSHQNRVNISTGMRDDFKWWRDLAPNFKAAP